MISNPFFLLSIVTSAFLAFYAMAFIVELVIKVFSIKKYRIRSILRVLPFVNVVFDFVFGRFSIGNWLNPLSCSSCVQKFVLQTFFPELKHHLAVNEIALVKYLAIDGYDTLFSSIFIAFCGVTAFFFLRKMYQIFFVCRSLRSMEKQGTRYEGKIQNSPLEEALIRSNVQLISNDQVQMPMTAYHSAIFIPSKIKETLSEGELEAVIAHELEHVRYKDPVFKVFSQTIATLIWWVPTQSWLKKMEQDQELGCDEGTAKYSCNEEFLASAIVKMSRKSRDSGNEQLCYLTEKTHPSLLRIQVLLGLLPSKQKSLLTSGLIGSAIGASVLFVCMMWL
jgi:beta-lactamase regulating signal transducer with metallopeptidase domain